MAKKASPATHYPKVFIGSSKEGLRIAQAIGANLEHVAEVTIWSNAFDLSGTTIESLEKAVEKHRFAIFVFTADDEIKYRGAKLKAARDNVLWEHGLFSGKNGRKRTFMVMPRGVKNFKLPTDLLGITTATYDPARLGGNPRAALQTACLEITLAIEAAGELSQSVDQGAPIKEQIRAFRSIYPSLQQARIDLNRLAAVLPSDVTGIDINDVIHALREQGIATQQSLDLVRIELAAAREDLSQPMYDAATRFLKAGKEYLASVMFDYGKETRTAEEIDEDQRTKATELVKAIEFLADQSNRQLEGFK
jgi:hypothetical protein